MAWPDPNGMAPMAVERALMLSDAEKIEPAHLHVPGAEGVPPVTGEKAQLPELPVRLKDAERVLTNSAIRAADGKISRAAKMLGSPRARLPLVGCRGR